MQTNTSLPSLCYNLETLHTGQRHDHIAATMLKAAGGNGSTNITVTSLDLVSATIICSDGLWLAL